MIEAENKTSVVDRYINMYKNIHTYRNTETTRAMLRSIQQELDDHITCRQGLNQEELEKFKAAGLIVNLEHLS